MPTTKESLFETFHIDEGNARRILVKNRAGALLLPVWAAIAAIAAIVTDAVVTVEKRTDAGTS